MKTPESIQGAAPQSAVGLTDGKGATLQSRDVIASTANARDSQRSEKPVAAKSSRRGTKKRGELEARRKAAQGTTDAARPFARTPLPPDVWEMRDEELERGLELHLALTSIARRIAFREIELLEKLHACTAYFRAFRLRFEKEATEMSEMAKVPGETERFGKKFYMPEEKPCA